MNACSKSRFSGKIAIVTASTHGIGYNIAKRLAQEKAKVIISSRKEKNVESAVETLKSEGLDVTGVVCHVGKPDHRKKLFKTAKELGGLDILVSNAGVNPVIAKTVLECEESAWDKIFEVNVKASFLLAKEALPLLRQRPYGRIIFMSSISAYHVDIKYLGAYAVSKTALGALTRAAALQLAKENITVNCLAPGPTETRFLKQFLSKVGPEETIAKIPMKRLGQPEDMEGVAAFIASEDASYVTGETVVIGGGMESRL